MATLHKGNNMHDAFDKFDQMSMQQDLGAAPQVPDFSNIDAFSAYGDDVTPVGASPDLGGLNSTEPDKGKKQGSAFRPVVHKKEKARWVADKKEAVQFGATQEQIAAVKKKFSFKKLLPVFIGLILFIVLANTVTPLKNFLLEVFKSADKLFLEGENKYYSLQVKNSVDRSGNFTKFTTDNAIKGTLQLTLTEAGAENLTNTHALAGEYSGDYSLAFVGDTNRFDYTYSKDGYDIGTTSLVYSAKNATVNLFPSFNNETALSASMVDVVPVLNEMGLKAVNEDKLYKTLNGYSGINIQNLYALASSDEALKKIFDPYKDILKELSFDATADRDLGAFEKFGAKRRLIIAVRWEDFKACMDELILTAKGDSRGLMSLFESLGYSQQKYLDMLNDLSVKVETAYSSVSPDSIVAWYVYIDSNREIVAQTMGIPVNSSETLQLQLVDSPEAKRLYIEKSGTVYDDISITITDSENGSYTGVFTVIQNEAQVKGIFEGLVLSDTPSGHIVITKGNREYDISLTPGNCSLKQSYNGVDELSLTATISTYATATLANSNKNFAWLTDKTEEKAYLSYMDTADVSNIIAAFPPAELDYSEEKVKAFLASIIYRFKQGDYVVTFPDTAELTEEVVDLEGQIANAVNEANQNAENIAIAASRFINACLNNTEKPQEIPNGAYTGVINERDAGNLSSYKYEFTEQNIQKCMGANVMSGYYCFVVKDNIVTYAFWSGYEDFADRVARKDLPALFDNFTTVEEVKGSYPRLSGQSNLGGSTGNNENNGGIGNEE